MTQMKKFFPVFGLLLGTLIFSACNKKEQIIQTVDEGDAVEIIEAAFQTSAGGVTTNLEDLADQLTTAISSGLLCDSMYNYTAQRDYQGTQLQASYGSDISFEMVCNNFDIPQSATIAAVTASNYNTQRINSDDDSDFEGTVTGLQPSALQMTFNATFNRIGAQQLLFKNQNNINSNLSLNLNDVKLEKQSQEIVSGTGSFTFTGTVNSETFSYAGNITFNGGKTATIVINGTTYTIDLN